MINKNQRVYIAFYVNILFIHGPNKVNLRWIKSIVFDLRPTQNTTYLVRITYSTCWVSYQEVVKKLLSSSLIENFREKKIDDGELPKGEFVICDEDQFIETNDDSSIFKN